MVSLIISPLPIRHHNCSPAVADWWPAFSETLPSSGNSPNQTRGCRPNRLAPPSPTPNADLSQTGESDCVNLERHRPGHGPGRHLPRHLPAPVLSYFLYAGSRTRIIGRPGKNGCPADDRRGGRHIPGIGGSLGLLTPGRGRHAAKTRASCVEQFGLRDSYPTRPPEFVRIIGAHFAQGTYDGSRISFVKRSPINHSLT